MKSAFPALLLASTRAYYRNRVAMFFSLFFPLVFMMFFGLLNLGGNVKENVAIVDLAHNDASASVTAAMKKVRFFNIRTGTEADERAALKKGDVVLMVVLPSGLTFPGVCPAGQRCPAGIAGAVSQGSTYVPVYGSSAKPQDTPIALAAVQQIFDNISFAASGHPAALAPAFQELDGKDIRYVDFLVPGIIAFSIMSTGINSIGFALVAMKKSGVIRRLMATPMRVTDFMAAQVGTRMIMSLVQVGVLLGVAMVSFKFQPAGNLASMLLVALFGAGIFIALGFAVAGVAKDEDTVPALVNLITLPMMILSGVFFPTSAIPDWLRTVSSVLPLTYLADALRGISVNGDSLWAVRGDLLGIGVWLVVATLIATRLFRWDLS